MKMARRILLLLFLLASSNLSAAEPQPQYTRTRQLPALRMTFADMQVILDKAAHLMADANKEAAKKANEAKEGNGLQDLFLFSQRSPRETLTVGTGPDEIQIAGHTFSGNAHISKAAYALSYSYSWAEAPVSKLELDLRDYARHLSVTGTAVDQVQAISAALEGDLSEHSAIGGDNVRLNLVGATVIVLLMSLTFGAAYCFLEKKWRFLGIPIFSLVGLILLFMLPLKDVFAGFALYEGEASWIVRYAPQIGFVGLIITIVLSLIIPWWYGTQSA